MSNTPHQIERESRKRQDRLIVDADHDPYHATRKIKSPAVCPDCAAVYRDGRWTWQAATDDASEHRCPACQRIADRLPAAFLSIRGRFFRKHRREILNLIQNTAAREREAHPLKRIMAIDELASNVELTFTDAHLARGIGEALHNAYGGDIEYQYSKGDILLRVTWRR